jgi:hypothetical protein
VEPNDLREVALTEQEKSYLVDAWLSYIHLLPPDTEPDLAGLEHNPIFKATINGILAAHDFEPFTATFVMGDDDQLVVMARPLPTTRPTEPTGP